MRFTAKVKLRTHVLNEKGTMAFEHVIMFVSSDPLVRFI